MRKLVNKHKLTVSHSDLGKAAAKNGLVHVQAGGSFKHNVFQLKDAWLVAGT